MTNKICKKCGIQELFHNPKNLLYNRTCKKFELLIPKKIVDNSNKFETVDSSKELNKLLKKDLKILEKPKNHKEVGRAIIKEVLSKKVDEAWEFAKEKHKNQLDDMNKDYFESHCVVVMKILEKVTKNPQVLIAGLLHDTIEDTNTKYDELKEKFGKEVADLVNEVTHEGQADERGFFFPRLHSKEGIMIKLSDRLSNISRMDSWTKERQNHYLKNTKFWRSEEKEVKK